jgi:hypothetical protein
MPRTVILRSPSTAPPRRFHTPASRNPRTVWYEGLCGGIRGSAALATRQIPRRRLDLPHSPPSLGAAKTDPHSGSECTESFPFFVRRSRVDNLDSRRKPNSLSSRPQAVEYFGRDVSEPAKPTGGPSISCSLRINRVAVVLRGARTANRSGQRVRYGHAKAS